MLVFAVSLALVLSGSGDRTMKLDVVELVRGSEVAGVEEYALRHAGHRYLFASEESLRAFAARPWRYEVQLGGACARMGPLSGLGSTEILAVHEGRVFLFASEACREGFLKDPERVLERDDPVPESNPETLRRGRELIEGAVRAMGGAERVDGVHSLRLRWEGTVEAGGREYRRKRRVAIVFPGSFRVDSAWDDEDHAHVVAAGSGFFDDAGEARNMHEQQIAAAVKQLRREPLVILRARDRDGFVAVASGHGTVGERPVELVTAAFEGATATLEIDAENGRMLGLTYRGRGPDRHFGTLHRTFSDFREVGGLELPATFAVRFDGEDLPDEGLTWTSIEVDVEIPADRFTRPG